MGSHGATGGVVATMVGFGERLVIGLGPWIGSRMAQIGRAHGALFHTAEIRTVRSRSKGGMETRFRSYLI
jgi:hypothetical protein